MDDPFLSELHHPLELTRRTPSKPLAAVQIISLVLVAAAIASGHVKNPGDCDVGKNAQTASGNVDRPPDYTFRWESSAGKVGERWCYDRLVRNQHKAYSLAYEWPDADLSSVYGLLPGQEGHNNFDVAEGPPTNKGGPLFFGVKKDLKTPTTVYQVPGEGTRQTANARIAMRVKDSSGEVIDIRLVLGTSVAAKNLWQFGYRLANYGDAIGLFWQPVEYPDFAAQVKRTVGSWSPGEPLPLKKEAILEIVFDAKLSPKLAISRVLLVDRFGKVIATAVAPTYIPRR